MRGATFFVLLLAAGCQYNDVGAIDDAHDKKVAEETARYDVDARRYVSCDDAPAGATCGLLFDQINPDTYKVKACGLASDDAMSDDCHEKFVATFYKQLRLRYALADWGKVEAYCRGGAGRCNSLRDIERALLQTHNANAEREHEAAVADLDKKHKTEVQDAEDENFLMMAASGNAAMQTTNAGMQNSAPAAMPPPPMFMH